MRGDTERSLVHRGSWFAGFCRPVTLPACDSLARLLDLVFDPVGDVAPLVANMSSHAEPTGSFSAIPPLVERGCRHTEIFGEVLHGEEAIREFHSRILLPDPVNKVFVTLSSGFQSDTSLPCSSLVLRRSVACRPLPLKNRFRELEGYEHSVDRVTNTLLTG